MNGHIIRTVPRSGNRVVRSPAAPARAPYQGMPPGPPGFNLPGEGALL